MTELSFLPYLENHPRWEEADAFLEAAYPPFMHHDPIANARFGVLYEMYPDWQQVAVEGGHAIGWLNSAPLPWPVDAPLPDEGWDAAMLAATDAPADAAESGTAFGIQIVIGDEYQGRGLSRSLVQRMRDVAQAHGARRLVVPVRPAGKGRYPLVSMESYATWRNESGSVFDPWLRVHVSLGGRIVGPCDRAMTITGSIAEWEAWTGMRFPSTGRYVVEGALAPVSVDVAADRVTYVEPNLWLEHAIDAAP